MQKIERNRSQFFDKSELQQSEKQLAGSAGRKED